MRFLLQLRFLALASFLALGLSLSGCREEPSQQECEAAAKKRARYFFGSDANGSDRLKKRGAKMEYEDSLRECKASWSKSKATCITKAKNRNMLISCK